MGANDKLAVLCLQTLTSALQCRHLPDNDALQYQEETIYNIS